jgi:hypothetical protein
LHDRGHTETAACGLAHTGAYLAEQPGMTSPLAAADVDLSTFYLDRARQHRKYLDGCQLLADKAIAFFQPRFGPAAKIAAQALKAANEQKAIAPNALLQPDGSTVFGYAVDFESPELPVCSVNFLLRVGKMSPPKQSESDRAGPERWYIGHDEKNFVLNDGGEDGELEPLLAHVVHALQQAVVSLSPTATVPVTRRNDAPVQSRQQAPGAPGAPEAPPTPAAQATEKPAPASAT